MHGCFCVSVGLCVQHTLHLGIREWWAIESIRHVISKAVHLSIWVSEILRGKCRVCIPPWEPRVLQLLMLAFLGLFNVHTREELMQKKKKNPKPRVDFASYHSLSFCICSTLRTILHSLFYFVLDHSLFVFPHLLIQPLLFLLSISLCSCWIYCNQLCQRSWFAIIWKSDLILPRSWAINTWQEGGPTALQILIFS